MWIKRTFENALPTLSLQPVLVVEGVRQAGKTALVQEIMQLQGTNLSLDDFAVRDALQRDPALFLDLHTPPLLLDEVQYAPQMFPEIKKRVDQYKSDRRKGTSGSPMITLFWLTGSNQILMRKSTQESLAGRASFLKLHPLSVEEILGGIPETPLSHFFERGGWPELYAEPTLSHVEYLNAYIATVLEKDVTQSAGIQKVNEFSRVLRLAASRIGNLLSLSDISKDAGVRVSTVSEWIGFLEQMGFVTLLQPYFTNLNSRLIKTPKFFFNDVGLALRLQGWQHASQALLSPQAGSLFECLVWTELLKARDHRHHSWEFFFWRTKEGHEVDFVVKNADKVLAIEVKMTAINSASSFDFLPLRKVFGDKLHTAVVSLSGMKIKLRDNSGNFVDVVPVSQLAAFALEKLE